MAERFIIDGNFTQSFIGTVALTAQACPPGLSTQELASIYYDLNTGVVCYQTSSTDFCYEYVFDNTLYPSTIREGKSFLVPSAGSGKFQFVTTSSLNSTVNGATNSVSEALYLLFNTQSNNSGDLTNYLLQNAESGSIRFSTSTKNVQFKYNNQAQFFGNQISLGQTDQTASIQGSSSLSVLTSNTDTPFINGEKVCIQITALADTGFPFTGSAGILGSLNVDGTISASGGVTSSLLGTASYAVSSSMAFSSSNAEKVLVRDFSFNSKFSIPYVSGKGMKILNIDPDGASIFGYDPSLNTFNVPNISSSGIISASDIIITNTASISYLHSYYESASIIYTSGSTKFGDTIDDTHQRTGSMFISGNLDITGSISASGTAFIDRIEVGHRNDRTSTSRLVINKDNNSRAIIEFPQSSSGDENDPAFIRHTELSPDVGRMEFCVSDQDGASDVFAFGHATSGDPNNALNAKVTLTAKGNVSASGLLFISTSHDNAGAFSNVVVADTASGRFYVTSSYGGGGSTGDTFPFTGSAAISGTLSVEGELGHITSSGDVSASGTGSFSMIKGIVDTVGASVNDLLTFNGTSFVPAPPDTTFVFSIADFDISGQGNSSQLIGSGVYKSSGAISFVASYNNGPPNGSPKPPFVQLRTGSSAQTLQDITHSMNASAFTNGTTGEDINYPSAVNHQLRFRLIATRSSDLDTDNSDQTVTFRNFLAFGGLDTNTSLNSAKITTLSQSNAQLQSSTTVADTVTTALDNDEFFCYAYRDALSDVKMVTCGSGPNRITVAMDHTDRADKTANVTSGISHTNTLGFTENYAIVASSGSNLDAHSTTFQTLTSDSVVFNYLHWGTSSNASLSSEDNVRNLDYSSSFSNSIVDTSNPNILIVTGDFDAFIYIGIPARYGVNGTDFTLKDNSTNLAIALNSPTGISASNPVGFFEEYKLYRSTNQLVTSNFQIKIDQ